MRENCQRFSAAEKHPDWLLPAIKRASRLGIQLPASLPNEEYLPGQLPSRARQLLIYVLISKLRSLVGQQSACKVENCKINSRAPSVLEC